MAYHKKQAQVAAVIGGGLLSRAGGHARFGHEDPYPGVRAHPHVPLINKGGHGALVGMVEGLGLEVHCAARKAFEADVKEGLEVTFETEGWDDLDVGIVVVSAGIKTARRGRQRRRRVPRKGRRCCF